jgi:hypothetical protein
LFGNREFRASLRLAIFGSVPGFGFGRLIYRFDRGFPTGLFEKCS